MSNPDMAGMGAGAPCGRWGHPDVPVVGTYKHPDVRQRVGDRPRRGWNRLAGVGGRPDVVGMRNVPLVSAGILQMCPARDRSPPSRGAVRGGPTPAAPVGGAYNPASRDVTRVLIPTVATGNGPSASPPHSLSQSRTSIGQGCCPSTLCGALIGYLAVKPRPSALLMPRARRSRRDRCGAGGA